MSLSNLSVEELFKHLGCDESIGLYGSIIYDIYRSNSQRPITYKLKDGVALDIPSGVSHRIMNTSNSETLKLYTVYSPPEHPDKLIQICKPLPNKRPNKSIFNLLNF